MTNNEWLILLSEADREYEKTLRAGAFAHMVNLRHITLLNKQYVVMRREHVMNMLERSAAEQNLEA